MARRFEGYMRGVNLGGWFSQCDHTQERYDRFITREDIRTLGTWGLDHLRLPVDYDLVETADGTYKEDGFARIQQVIGWCREEGLHLILDLHKTAGYSFDEGEGENGFFESEQYQERFYRLWEAFASRFGQNRDMMAFELLNEVTDASYCDLWNRIAQTCIGRIRRIGPEIDILVGGYWNNSVEAVRDLFTPTDPHIVYNFHCYEPIIFTHQGAYWIPGMDTSFRTGLDCTFGELQEKTKEQVPMPFTGPDLLDREDMLCADYFKKLFADAVAAAEERDVRIYCGEYGVIDRASPEDTVKWYRMIHEAFESYGIGRAAWSAREMDFGLMDARLDGVRQELVSLL